MRSIYKHAGIKPLRDERNNEFGHDVNGHFLGDGKSEVMM
jgi:hypothetical protein